MAGCGTDAEVQAAEIGTLDSYIPIEFSETAGNIVDAAIGLTDADRVGTATPDDGYGTPSSTTVDAELGQLVQKYGRTTGLTYGKVTGIDASVLISYSTGTAKFVNQVIVSGTRGAFSKGGDSGSLIVTRGSNNPVALLFAGSNTITIGNPIAAVLDSFGVSIDSGVLPSIPPTVESIYPPSAQAGTITNATINGTGFVSGASVTLLNGSGPAPSVSNVVVTSSTTITAKITTNRKSKASTWDVRVTNPDGLSDVGADAFTVTR
jgi:hypothetical protein